MEQSLRNSTQRRQKSASLHSTNASHHPTQRYSSSPVTMSFHQHQATSPSNPSTSYPHQQQQLSYASPFNLSSLTNQEVLKSAANRMLHSKQYKLLYFGMAFLSLLSLLFSLFSSISCPPSWFWWVEGMVLITMLFEFGLRVGLSHLPIPSNLIYSIYDTHIFALQYTALGSSYFANLANIADLGLVTLCLFLFLALLGKSHSCSAEESAEVMLEEGLLLVRNGIQFWRLVTMLQKYIVFIFIYPILAWLTRLCHFPRVPCRSQAPTSRRVELDAVAGVSSSHLLNEAYLMESGLESAHDDF